MIILKHCFPKCSLTMYIPFFALEQRWIDGDLGLKTQKIKGKGNDSEIVEEDAGKCGLM